MPDENKLPWYKRKKIQVVLAVVIVLFFCSLFIMAINYSFPNFFNLAVQEDGTVRAEAAAVGEPVKAPPANWTKGLMMTDTLIVIGDDLFSNWLPNDQIWPTVFLDNPQNYQLGALEMMRYTVRTMRDNLARFGSADAMNQECDQAFTLLSINAKKWMFPRAESEYKKALDALRVYRQKLAAGEAGFSPREDNLKELLQQYVSLLGAINNRLANAPGSQRAKGGQPTAAESAADPAASQVEQYGAVDVPWHQIDDNFYYAQGAAYVLRQMLAAIKYDFSVILDSKNAGPQVDNIIAVLDQCQFEPLIVLNGDIGSITANHSMELHSLLENARQRIRNLSEMLRQTN
jgi:Uncharacterized protein conserved in bacteria